MSVTTLVIAVTAFNVAFWIGFTVAKIQDARDARRAQRRQAAEDRR